MSTLPEVFFDDSLLKFVGAIGEHLGDEVLEQGIVLRDSSGRLRFLSNQPSPSQDRRADLEMRIVGLVGAYARADDLLTFADELDVQSVLNDPEAFPMRDNSRSFRLLDKRIIGSSWLDRPKEGVVGPPRIVFASLKGGVGRSTALAVAASDLSRRNKNVLVIDLDLEAPGIGEILLEGERLPRFGTVDYLVENGLRGVADRYLPDFVGTSGLTSPTGGRVDVVPALGRAGIEHPYNILPKLSRALIEDIGPSGDAISLTGKIADMIGRLSGRDPYDVILIDSRAGLSELAAPTMLGLGAAVLLFGTAQRQTIQGYTGLFAALKSLAERDRAAGRRAEWRLSFKAVYAKAGLDETAAARYRDDLYDLFAENLYDADNPQQENDDTLSFDIDDQNAPHWPLVVPFNQNFIDFDPVQTPSQLTSGFYEQVYRQFLDGIDSIIQSGDVSQNRMENDR